MSNSIKKLNFLLSLVFIFVFSVSGTSFAITKSENLVDDGWVQCHGSWHYYDHGNAATGWEIIDGVTYYFDEEGHMATGECMVEGHAYTFNSAGGFLYNGIHRNGFDDELLTKAFELCCQSEADGLHMTDLINQERMVYGMIPVVYDRDLAVLATYRCLHMEKNNYFSHYFTSSTIPQFALDYATYGYDRNGGENLSRSSYADFTELSLMDVNAKAMGTFRNSSSHHNNIIDSRWTSVGVGYYIMPNSNKIMISQLYK